MTEPWIDSINIVIDALNATVTADTDAAVSQRQPGQIVLNLFIIQIACAVAVGHLGSLRNMPSDYHARLVICSIFIPVLPVVDMFADIDMALRQKRVRHGRWRYFLACLAGANAVYCDETGEGKRQPLVDLDPTDVERTETWNRYNVKWIARIVVLLAFLAQILATLFLSIRRIIMVGIYSQLPIDSRVLVLGVSGLIVGLTSLMIQFGGEWRMRVRQPIERQKKFKYILGTAMFLHFSIISLTLKGLGIVWVTSTLAIFVVFLFLLCLGGCLKLRIDKELVQMCTLYFVYCWTLAGFSALFNEILFTWSEFYSLNSTANWRWEDPLIGNLWVF
jgi:hypothetical protein